MDNVKETVNSEAYAAWKTHPVTQVFFKYLHDYRIAIAEDAAEMIADGVPPTPDSARQAAHFCDVLGDIESLKAENINEFYHVEKEEENEQDEQAA